MSLLLSEQYGVPFNLAFRVVEGFLLKVLLDDSILPDQTERIFTEVLSAFPPDKDKRTLGKMFITVSMQIIDRMSESIIVRGRSQEKIKSLSQLASIFTDGNKLWTPK